MYYVYQLRHPDYELPFYVGKGKGNRAFQHLNPTIYKTTKRFYYKLINKMIENDIEPIVEFIVENIEDEDDAYLYEEFYINAYGLRKDGGCLLNHIKGGRLGVGVHRHNFLQQTNSGKVRSYNPNTGVESFTLPEDVPSENIRGFSPRSYKNYLESRPVYTDEYRQKLSMSARARTDDRSHSEETKKKISTYHSNRSLEFREKIRQNRIGKKHSEEAKKKMSESAKKRPRRQHTPESIEKMKVARKRTWDIKKGIIVDEA